MKILILCTGNSCRSQMAHAYLQSFNPQMRVASAGTKPAAQVHPLAIKVMQEEGLDISNHRPVAVEDYLQEPWDYVITVCGGAKESCPIFTGEVSHHLHIGFDDPAHIEGSQEFVLQAFRRIREEIKAGFFSFYNTEIKHKLS